MSLKIKVKKLDREAKLPTRAYNNAACWDVYANRVLMINGDTNLQQNILSVHGFNLAPGMTAIIGIGMIFEIPDGWEIQVRPRSGYAAKNKITIMNSPGTIDSDYRGEIGIIVHNHHPTKSFTIKKGMKLAQIKLSRVYDCEFQDVDSLSDTERGDGGFGSSGE